MAFKTSLDVTIVTKRDVVAADLEKIEAILDVWLMPALKLSALDEKLGNKNVVVDFDESVL